jgi:hypothetical protein
LRKNWRFLVFEKNANFFAENWQKSKKIIIITLTPGHPVLLSSFSMLPILAIVFLQAAKDGTPLR